ncbi:hypothetical protein [Parvibaculum sp.]|uniref:hypothetical protein n=1 Tax=Parvibaculum sp. TaxID=2024848 RepID=UPI00391CDE75
MNVFVLCTGRCGSTTFVKAASHIENYTAGHETRSRFLGEERLTYPPNHIEADNRLSWLLGRLENSFGKEAFYVHLQRDREAVARSYALRFDNKVSIVRAYKEGILMDTRARERIPLCLDYVDTVTANISHFLRDKPNQMAFRLENAEQDWMSFWARIGAEGDSSAALLEWKVKHNAH